MKKSIISLIMCLFLITGQAQDSLSVVKKPKTEAELTKNCIKATIVIEVYKSQNGKFFRIKKKKDGTLYKDYL